MRCRFGTSSDSFDVEFSPAGKVIQKTNYIGAGTIKSSERFLYSDDGKLIESVSLDSLGLQVSSTHYRHDDEGRLVSWIGYDQSGAVTRRGTERYMGKLLVSSASSEATGSPVLQKTFEYADEKLSKSAPLLRNWRQSSRGLDFVLQLV
jgi:hypothetical protein